jgi:RNA polymerase sigma-70 factor (ECF subfamily)
MNEDERNKEHQFRALYQTYYAPFCIYAKRFILDGAVREDIVSDVFYKLWLKSDENILKEEVALSYIKTSVRNNCLNYLKHQTYENDFEEHFEEHIPIYAESPESIYTLDEMYKLLHNALEKLPENQRKVFIESFLNNKKQTEIADELNISVKTVKRYRDQIIEQLRNELKDYMPAMALLSILIAK